MLRAANLGLRFLLELCALAAVGAAAVHAVDGVAGWLLALAAAATFAAAWGAFVSPKARLELTPPLRFAVELGLWSIAAAAVASTGRRGLALAFLAVALVSGTLNYRWR